MAKLELKKISGKSAARIATLVVTLLCVGSILAMGLFIFNTIDKFTTSSSPLSESEQEAVETIDLDGLAVLQAKLTEKNALDEARAGRPHNPFADISIRKETVIQPSPTQPEPEPIPEPEPTPDEDLDELPEPEDTIEPEPED